jgi:hypothetical protein
MPARDEKVLATGRKATGQAMKMTWLRGFAKIGCDKSQRSTFMPDTCTDLWSCSLPLLSVSD